MIRNNKLLITQGALYTTIAMLTPAMTLLASDQELSNRTLLVLVVSSVIAGATALKAFLSTTFADSPANLDSEPKAVTIDQPLGKPVITKEVDKG